MLSPLTAVRLDIRRGVVSLLNSRGAGARTGTGLAETAREAYMTLTKAVAVRASTAESPEAIEAARHFVRRRYAWRGYDSPEQQDAALDTPAGHPAREITFVAIDDDATVGTVTLGLDGPSGLLAEGTHRDAVHKQRAAGRNVCELTRLAVAERADSKSVLAALFSLAYAAGSVHGVTDLFIEVNPRHVGFYTRVLGFVVAAGEKLCERVRAPSVLLWLEIDQLKIRLTKQTGLGCGPPRCAH